MKCNFGHYRCTVHNVIGKLILKMRPMNEHISKCLNSTSLKKIFLEHNCLLAQLRKSTPQVLCKN